MELQELVGKTIQTATKMKVDLYDDEDYLRFTFTDETECFVQALYGGYSGDSKDEYPAYLTVSEKIEVEEGEQLVSVVEKEGTA